MCPCRLTDSFRFAWGHPGFIPGNLSALENVEGFHPSCVHGCVCVCVCEFLHLCKWVELPEAGSVKCVNLQVRCLWDSVDI